MNTVPCGITLIGSDNVEHEIGVGMTYVEKSIPSKVEAAFTVKGTPSCPPSLTDTTLKFAFADEQATAVMISLDVADPTQVSAAHVSFCFYLFFNVKP